MNKYIIFTFAFLLIFPTIYYCYLRTVKSNLNFNYNYKNTLETQHCNIIMMKINMEMLNRQKETFYIESPNKKLNLALPYEEEIVDYIKNILKNKNIDTVRYFIVECGTILLYPNSKSTKFHTKSDPKDNKKIITFYISMTNNNNLEFKKNKKLIKTEYERGDMIILDSREEIRFTQNNSNEIIPYFFFSIVEKNNIDINCNMLTLKSKYRGKILI